MIRRERVIKKLEEIGFVYVSGAARNDLFKARINGMVRYASLVRHDYLENETVRSILNQAGCDIEEIERFISCC